MGALLKFIPDIDKNLMKIVSILSEANNWGLSFVDVEDAWKHTKGAGVKVAVIDTGWWPHKDLVANFLEGYDATGGNDYNDHGNFHAVHVCGIIAANPSEPSIGVTGVAPDSKLVPIKALDDSGSGSYDYIVNALRIVKNLDVDIINMSLGTPVAPDNEDLHDIIKEVAAQGKIIVCAAGNDGGDVNYPAKYDEVVAVAAVDSSGKLARFSSKGPELDTAAPGVHIYSTWGNNQYINLDGTSMACPMISGIISLIVSNLKAENKKEEINYKNIIKILQQMGGDEGEHIIQAGSFDVGVPKFCNYNWDN
jgi:subtilisin family serine protease